MKVTNWLIHLPANKFNSLDCRLSTVENQPTVDHYVSCVVAPIRILTIDNDLIRIYNKQSHTHTNSLTTLYPHTHTLAHFPSYPLPESSHKWQTFHKGFSQKTFSVHAYASCVCVWVCACCLIYTFTTKSTNTHTYTHTDALAHWQIYYCPGERIKNFRAFLARFIERQ